MYNLIIFGKITALQPSPQPSFSTFRRPRKTLRARLQVVLSLPSTPGRRWPAFTVDSVSAPLEVSRLSCVPVTRSFSWLNSVSLCSKFFKNGFIEIEFTHPQVHFLKWFLVHKGMQPSLSDHLCHRPPKGTPCRERRSHSCRLSFPFSCRLSSPAVGHPFRAFCRCGRAFCITGIRQHVALCL